MTIVDIIAEKRIREAAERGELDDLPGKGEPLELEDLSMVWEPLIPSLAPTAVEIFSLARRDERSVAPVLHE